MPVLRFSGSSDIKVAVRDWIAGRADVAGRVVIDIPAGNGEMSAALAAAGARVESFDLFPEAFRAAGLTCRPADLRGTVPIGDGHADLVLFQEAIEHLPDPLHGLRELQRILRPGGTLLLTTPNASHLRARASHFLLESDLYNRLPQGELDAVWQSGSGEPYYGHLFLIGAQRLRTLARLAGFRLVRIHPTKVSVSSLLLGLTYPAIAAVTLHAAWRTRRRFAGVDAAIRDAALTEVVRLNLHPATLFGKHLFWEFERVEPWDPQRSAGAKDPATIR